MNRNLLVTAVAGFVLLASWLLLTDQREPAEAGHVDAAASSAQVLPSPSKLAAAQVERRPEALPAAAAEPDLPRSEALSLRIRGRDGRELAGAAVELWPAGPVPKGPDWPARAPLFRGTTDASGHLSLPVQGDDQQFVVDAPFRDTFTSGLWSVAEARAARDALGEVPITLHESMSIAGKVLRPDGRGVSGAIISFRLSESPGGPGRPRQPGPVRANVHGYFDVEADPGSTLQVTARLHGKVSETLTVQPQAESGFIGELLLDAQDTYAIDVGWDLESLPEPRRREFGMRPMLWSDPANGTDGPPRTLNEHSGYADTLYGNPDWHYRFPVSRPGRYIVVPVVASMGIAAPVDVVLTPQQPRAAARLKLEPGASLAGTLVRADGSPVPGIRVWAQAGGALRQSCNLGPLIGGIAYGFGLSRTDADGRFLFDGLQPGQRYRVECTLTEAQSVDGGVPPVFGRALVARDVPSGTTDLRMVAVEGIVPGIELRGRLVDGVSGEGIDAGSVSVMHMGVALEPYREQGVVIEREPGGRFRIPDLIEGDLYALEAHVDPAPGSEPRARVSSDWFVLERTLGEVRLVLPRRAVLEVAVRDAAGTPLPDASLDLLPTRLHPWLDNHSGKSRAGDGMARLDRLDPGPYTLIGMAGPYEGQLDVLVRAGEHASIVLVLQRGD